VRKDRVGLRALILTALSLWVPLPAVLLSDLLVPLTLHSTLITKTSKDKLCSLHHTMYKYFERFLVKTAIISPKRVTEIFLSSFTPNFVQYSNSDSVGPSVVCRL
jgi:hypothetical protein